MKTNEKIERILRTRGFIFPETIEEVIEFEKIYGTTEVILPYELQNPSYLCEQYSEDDHSEKDVNVGFALAARELPTGLPKEIKDKIKSDIEKFESKKIDVPKH